MMDSVDPTDKFASLEVELAAKSTRIAELEARVLLLETENARLRRRWTVAKGESPDIQGEEDPTFGPLVGAPGGNNQRAAEKPRGGGACDVIVLNDGGEGIAIDANKERSLEAGVAAVPTTRKRAVRVVTGESEEVEGSSGNKGIAHCDNDSWLEDDDVLVTPRSKKRAAATRVVTSDSEDENGVELGRGDGDDGQEEGASPSRKCARRGIIDSDEEDGNEGVRAVVSEHASRLATPKVESEDEDDRIPISQVLKKFRKQRAGGGDDDEFSDAKECSTPITRRSARLVKTQSKKGQATRRVLSFIEPKEHEGSDDDTEEDSDMDDFINDGDSSEHGSGSAEGSCAETEVSDASIPDEESSLELEESDSEINYADVMASIGRKRKTQDWKFEAEMLAAFDEHPELCLKALCALYRRQTKEEQQEKATIFHNKRGFSQFDALRASCIAEFLLDGDRYGPLKKTVQDLEQYDHYAFEFCRKVASRYSKQLFEIYQNKEDPYFHL